MIRRLAFQQLRRRPVTTALLLLVVALAIGVSAFLTTLHQSLQRGLTLATEPFTLLVASPGSQHQLVLSTVFLQDRPLANLPYAEVTRLSDDRRLVRNAIPLAFGDTFQGYRVVGAVPAIFQVKAAPKAPAWLSLRAGRPFAAPFEAVIGHDVASRLHLQIGSTFQSSHGLLPGKKRTHAAHPFTVVGILDDVHGPYNQAILTDIASVWALHNATAREVSAIMVEPAGYSQAYVLASRYQHRKDAQLVFPAQTIVQFFNLMGRGEAMWRPVGALLLLLSILLVVITSYLSTLTRLREYAILRALGATEKDIVVLWLWQNGFLLVGGTVLGALFGIGGCAFLAHVLTASTAVTLPLTVTPALVLLLGAAIVIGLAASLAPAALLRRKLAAAQAEEL